MASQKYEFTVEMTCGGCEGAVKRVLGRLEGVDNFEINLEQKKVYVSTSLSSDVVLEALKKTGKAITFVGTC
ncbi:copper transport protein ATOX1-like [Lytechinus pictus]|uniref:copper transport protein ATOX1-like n=1 Tax=Lytechinus pictus TaxID=7653 RepID=UPI00240E11E4|nr:copper transport protein ATOX1-like [Lytechinus pictus]